MASALDRLAAQGNAPPPRRRGWAAGAGAGLLLALAKGKVLLAALKLEKLAVTVWTLFVAVGAYATLYGLPYAAGLVGLILIHELGHGVAAARVGLRVGAPVFIPFVGAFIALKERPQTVWQELVVAAGGPVVGGVASGLCVALSGGPGLLRAVGTTGLILNLFNLTPFWTLDGARMLKAVPARAGLVGVGLSAGVLVATAIAGHLNVFALLALGIAAFRLVSRRKAPPPSTLLERVEALGQPPPPAETQGAQAHTATLVYFGTFSALTAAVQLLPL